MVKSDLDEIRELLRMVAVQAADTEKRQAQHTAAHNKQMTEIRQTLAETVRELKGVAKLATNHERIIRKKLLV